MDSLLSSTAVVVAGGGGVIRRRMLLLVQSVPGMFYSSAGGYMLAVLVIVVRQWAGTIHVCVRALAVCYRSGETNQINQLLLGGEACKHRELSFETIDCDLWSKTMGFSTVFPVHSSMVDAWLLKIRL